MIGVIPFFVKQKRCPVIGTFPPPSSTMEKRNLTPEQAALIQERRAALLEVDADFRRFIEEHTKREHQDFAEMERELVDVIRKYPDFREVIVKRHQRLHKRDIQIESEDLLREFKKMYRITPELAAQTPLEPTILSINGVDLMTRHSLVGLNGDINAGKTPIALLLACMAINPACSSHEEIVGGLTMTALKGNVLYFDTELETDMLCHKVRCSWEKRLKHKQQDIRRLHYFPLRHIRTDMRLKMIEMQVREVKDVSFVVIDSFTQMGDKMESRDAIRLIDGVFELIDKYKFPVLATIHGNRGAKDTDIGKATGHIGAQLQEKASTYLRLMYDPNDESGDTRILTANFPNGKTRWGKRQDVNAAFRWDTETGGFIECEYIEPETPQRISVKEQTQHLLLTLSRQRPQGEYKFSELSEFFVKEGRLTESTAKRWITRSEKEWKLLTSIAKGVYQFSAN